MELLAEPDAPAPEVELVELEPLKIGGVGCVPVDVEGELGVLLCGVKTLPGSVEVVPESPDVEEPGCVLLAEPEGAADEGVVDDGDCDEEVED